MNSREAVRKRVEAWDRIPKHPDISHYGDKDHREWKQFFISDDCEPEMGRLPISSEKRNKSRFSITIVVDLFYLKEKKGLDAI